MIKTPKSQPMRCAFEGCHRTSDQPDDDFAYLAGWGPGVPDGYYCREHADALEVIACEDIAENARTAKPKKRRK